MSCYSIPGRSPMLRGDRTVMSTQRRSNPKGVRASALVEGQGPEMEVFFNGIQRLARSCRPCMLS